MKFPCIKDLASTDLKIVDINDSIQNAISTMVGTVHRNIIVRDDKNFLIFSVYDVLKLKQQNINLQMPLHSLCLTKLPTIDKEANILDALEYLQNQVGMIATLNEDGSLYGVVTNSDIISSIDPDVLMQSYRLRDFISENKIS